MSQYQQVTSVESVNDFSGRKSVVVFHQCGVCKNVFAETSFFRQTCFCRDYTAVFTVVKTDKMSCYLHRLRFWYLLNYSLLNIKWLAQSVIAVWAFGQEMITCLSGLWCISRRPIVSKRSSKLQR